MIKRCPWPSNNELMITYHDTEWGVPVHDDRIHFEFFLLDTFQAGLSWQIILNKRENFRKAFSNFNPKLISKYDTKKRTSLLNDAGIIRNRLKVDAAIENAQHFLEIQKEFGSFDKYVWSFVGGNPIINKRRTRNQIPATSKESHELSKDLKKRGFRFVGSTTLYAYMQGAGLVNDHLISCFRYTK